MQVLTTSDETVSIEMKELFIKLNTTHLCQPVLLLSA